MIEFAPEIDKETAVINELFSDDNMTAHCDEMNRDIKISFNDIELDKNKFVSGDTQQLSFFGGPSLSKKWTS